MPTDASVGREELGEHVVERLGGLEERAVTGVRERHQPRAADAFGEHAMVVRGEDRVLLAGDRTRAPVWMQRAGLEWFFRFVQEPRRLGRRYIVGNSIFVGLLVREIVRARIRPAPGRGTTA